jgi:alpha-tubulin suppressor-like RCC1 family protein
MMKRLILIALACGCWSKPERVPADGFDDPVRLAAGRKHACAIDNGGVLWCWGNNEHAQLGDRTDVRTGTARTVMQGKLWAWIAAGDGHTCGITDQSELWCWGDDSSGQVGHMANEPMAPPTLVTLPAGGVPLKIYAGSATTCAIDTAGRLSCWGIYDQDRVAHLAPMPVAPGGKESHWRSVAIGATHVCALSDDDNRAYCWGENHSGELGIDAPQSAADAIPKGDRELVALAAGPSATCGITLDRELVCWGDTAHGLIGPAPENTGHIDFLVDGDRRWTSVAIGIEHTCAIGDGGVYCFGTDERGVLGSFDQRRELPADPLPVPAPDVLHLVAGESFSCAITGAGHVTCWGSNSDGELGNGEIATQRAPVKIATQVQNITTGLHHTCFSDSNRDIICWGDNRYGQVMPGGPALIEAPRMIGQKGYLIAAGDRHTCVVDGVSNAFIHCWGDNAALQLGNATGMVRVADVSPNAIEWYGLAAGARATCGVDDAHELFCFGEVPGSVPGRPPTQASGSYTTMYRNDGLTRSLAVADHAVLAQSSVDNTSVAFGIEPEMSCGAHGDLSLPTTLPPTQATDNVDLALAAGGAHGCIMNRPQQGSGLLSVLACWGNNSHGQTAVPKADCTTYHTVAPPPQKAWRTDTSPTVATGGSHTCAITADQELYCWGLAERGVLANLTGESETPRLIPDHPFLRIYSGEDHMCAMENNDSTMLCWGENRFGEVGNGMRFHPDPVMVVGP